VALEPRPLVAIVVLAFGPESSPTTLAAVRGQSAFSVINAGYARFVVDDARIQVRDLDLIGRIAAYVPVHALTRPRSFGALGDSAQLLVRLATHPPRMSSGSGDM
jgi:hypothetical protein